MFNPRPQPNRLTAHLDEPAAAASHAAHVHPHTPPCPVTSSAAQTPTVCLRPSPRRTKMKQNTSMTSHLGKAQEFSQEIVPKSQMTSFWKGRPSTSTHSERIRRLSMLLSERMSTAPGTSYWRTRCGVVVWIRRKNWNYRREEKERLCVRLRHMCDVPA